MAASRNKRSADLGGQVGGFLAARLAPDERLVLGLSGGCDSIVLLHLLLGLGLGPRLQVLHVHHGLSPKASEWAAFCADLCARLGLLCTVHQVDVDRQSPLGLEAAAREARYRVFAGVSGDVLLLAQHRDDQAETVLLNLLRGGGVGGAAGMPEERTCGGMRLLRPLLGIGRSDIEAYALAQGLSWVEDESNADLRFARNYLRHRVMPLLSERFPGGGANLAQAAGHFAEADSLLADLAELDWVAVADGDAARLVDLKKLSSARLKNLLRFRLRRLGWRTPATQRLEEFVRQLQSAGPDRHPALDLPDGSMRAARGRLHWLAAG